MVTAIAGSAADDIVLVPPRGVPKTSSGKVRRSSAKELYETGRTDVKQHGVWLQIARLALSSAGRSATGFLRRIGDTLYAGWWYLVTALALVAAFLRHDDPADAVRRAGPRCAASRARRSRSPASR